jgi:hypothetical protein
MKITTIFILCFIFIEISCFSQYPPPNRIIKESCIIDELIVNDSTFLQRLDTAIFQRKCTSVNNAKIGFFDMRINQDSCRNSSFSIVIQFYKRLSVHNSSFGFLDYKNHIFFIYGENPYEIFSKTGESKEFVNERETIPILEDLPYWRLRLTKRKLRLEYFDCW